MRLVRTQSNSHGEEARPDRGAWDIGIPVAVHDSGRASDSLLASAVQYGPGVRHACQEGSLPVHCGAGDDARAARALAVAALRLPQGITGRDAMAIGFQPSQLLAAHLQVAQ